ncbi:MAG: hypothetical protein M1820_000119 [Bogoriella megaspora]|nr:MAG: hypothetical protein M1820_000119 [Bogoriella megaspora]
MPHLSGLCNETLEHIISYLLPIAKIQYFNSPHPFDLGPKNYLAITRVCRSLSEVALAYLYRDKALQLDVSVTSWTDQRIQRFNMRFNVSGVCLWSGLHSTEISDSNHVPDISRRMNNCIRSSNLKRFRKFYACLRIDESEDNVGNWRRLQERLHSFVDLLAFANSVHIVYVEVRRHKLDKRQGESPLSAEVGAPAEALCCTLDDDAVPCPDPSCRAARYAVIEPLRRLRGVQKVEIRAPISQDMIESVAKDMMNDA